MDERSPDPPGGAMYRLSTECLPPPEGGVQALAILSEDFFVTGHDDHLVTVWARIPGTREFASMQTLLEHQGMVRAIIGIPAGLTPALPTGGFATASLDKRVRLYSFDPSRRSAAFVRALDGHIGQGVISLSLTGRGELVSGGWEGHARVWDMASGACTCVLEGHENGTKVAGLSDGSIAIGSTGRKNEFNQHVDYKLRIWRHSEVPKPAYAVHKVLSDHDQAVQDVDSIPELGCVTASNDGTVKVRGMDGSVLETFTCPINPGEGKPWSVFRARVLPSGTIGACCEDNVLRLYSGETGLVDEVLLPGQPWCVAGFANGDIVVVGNQAGTSRRGHVYVLTSDPTRTCTGQEAARFRKDCEPPAKPSAGSASAGTGDQINVSGPYDQRESVRGQSDGQNGFFEKPGGAIMLCQWSAAASAWVDVGEVTDGPGGGEDVDMVGEGSNASASGGGGAGGGGRGSEAYDYTTAVTMDTATGMRSMQLSFNEEDDPITVAKEWVNHNGISEDCYEEVKNHIIMMKMSEGEGVRARKKASALAAGASFVHFPVKAYLDFSAGDVAKLSVKLWENNSALLTAGHPAAVVGLEEAQVKDVAAVLADTRRYHATTVPKPGVAVILNKLLAWPADKALPAVDLVRMLLIHPDGAEGVGSAGKATCLPALCALIKASRTPGREAELRPVALVATRALFNAFKNVGSRALVGGKEAQEVLLDCLADIVSHDHASVRVAGTVLLLNFSFLVAQAVREAGRTPVLGVGSGGGNPGAAAGAIDHDRVQQALALSMEALNAAKDDSAAVLNTLAAVGTLCSADKAFAAYAKGMDLPALVATTVGASANPDTVMAVDAASEVKRSQLKAVKEAGMELATLFK